MPRYIYEPLTPKEMGRMLNAVGLTARQFARTTGSDIRRVERWLSGEQPDPPMWVGSLLTALTVPEARALVKAFVDERVTNTEREPPE